MKILAAAKTDGIPLFVETRLELEVAGRAWSVTCVSMGNPHCVVFVDDVAELPAQIADFGDYEASDPRDLGNARQVILWGRNVYVSWSHLLPVLRHPNFSDTTGDVALYTALYGPRFALQSSDEVARAHGCTHTIVTGGMTPEQLAVEIPRRVRELTDGRGADVVIEVSSYATAPVADAQPSA